MHHMKVNPFAGYHGMLSDQTIVLRDSVMTLTLLSSQLNLCYGLLL